MTAPALRLFRAPFWFLRHGESEANRLRIIAGSLDVPLNATGRAQAQRAADLVAGLDIAAVYASPLVRAHDTARIVAGPLGLPVTLVPELAERNWGALEGRPRSERVRGVQPPGGETPEAFHARVVRGLARLDGAGTPLIVAHSGIYRVLVRLLGCDEPEEPVENCRPVRFAPAADGTDWCITMV